MEQGRRAELKAYVLQQLEERIKRVQEVVLQQAGVRARRRNIIAVLEMQYQQVIGFVEFGMMPTSLTREEFEERMAIVEEVIVELAAVPEGT